MAWSGNDPRSGRMAKVHDAYAEEPFSEDLINEAHRLIKKAVQVEALLEVAIMVALEIRLRHAAV